MTSTAKTRPPATPAPSGAKRRRLPWLVALVAVIAVGVLYVVFRSAHHDATSNAGSTAYQVGSPGIGATAPDFTLPATTGGSMHLGSMRGQTVLLYFQEGLTCEPCWTQIADLEKSAAAVKAAGVDRIVSITTDPIGLLRQKVADEHLRTAVLSDSALSVSRDYHANAYGMMGDSRDGHTFVLIGPDGRIRWRADYGGAPRFTMYVPVQQLLAALRAGTAGHG